MNFTNYCIITNRVSSLGGAQLYTLRRSRHLINKGVKLCIIVTDDSDFILKENFEGIPILKLAYLVNPPSLYSEKKVTTIIQNIKLFISEVISNSSELVIESHHPFLSIWGEIIAASLKCKHIIYFLSEPDLSSNSFHPFKEYFIWKWKNQQLIGISNQSLKIIFGLEYQPDYNIYVNVPFDTSEFAEITKPLFLDAIEKDAFVIGTISRLAKPYVKLLIENVLELSSKYNSRKFHLIIGGNDVNKSILPFLKQKYGKGNHNLTISFPGYLNPIGKDFFDHIDVFVGMGTAAVNSISQNCATITIDPENNNKASGIFGLTNNNFAYSESGIYYSTIELIESILNNDSLKQKAREMGFSLFNKEFSLNACMKKLDKTIYSSKADSQDWDLGYFFRIYARMASLYSRVTSSIYLHFMSLTNILRKK